MTISLKKRRENSDKMLKDSLEPSFVFVLDSAQNHNRHLAKHRLRLIPACHLGAKDHGQVQAVDRQEDAV